MPYRPKLLLKCQLCGKDIWKYQSQLQKNVFCGRKCANIYINTKIRNTPKMYPCTNCGKIISKKPSDFYDRVTHKSKNPFCSKKCSGTWCTKNKIGIHSENYHSKLRSQLELFIEQKLEHYFPYVPISFNERLICAPYEFDFWFEDLNLAIEFNGIHHYEPIHGEEQLLTIQSHDEYKRKFCEERNYQLLIIDNLVKFSKEFGENCWYEEIFPILLGKI